MLKEKQDYTILYEDENCLVIDKPAGVMVHPVAPHPQPLFDHVPSKALAEAQGEGEDANALAPLSIGEESESGVAPSPKLGEGRGEGGEGPELTISDWMGATYTDSKDIDSERPGIVHRLDRDTSGCLLLIKNNKAFQKYKTQFQEHTLKKVYYAIVSGIIKDDTGIIDHPIARARSDFRKKEVKNEFTKDYRGELREAITRYKVIERIKTKDGGGCTLIECLPLTGRTHQIRVHMRSIRHPIVGDQLYGSREGGKLADRQMLHAKSLEFITYIQNDRGDYKAKQIKVESLMPQDMIETLEKLRKM